MRLLLLLLTGCRAGDHDLLIDRAYWSQRLPLTLTENGSANDFGRCGRRWGFHACKCYAPSLDTVEALSSSSLAWTQDASRLAAAIARLQSHCDEAVTVWMPVWGLGGSLIAHLDEYVIPAWARGRAAALAERPYVRDGAEINVCSMARRSTDCFHAGSGRGERDDVPLGRRGRHAALYDVVRLLLGPAVALRFEKAPPRAAACGLAPERRPLRAALGRTAV